MKYLLIILIFMAPGIVWAGGYKHVTNNYYNYHTENVTKVTNLSGISEKDLATVSAMAGASAGHQFTRGTRSLQWSIAGACHDSSADDCGLSGALSQRIGEVLVTGIVSGGSDERVYIISVGGTF